MLEDSSSTKGGTLVQAQNADQELKISRLFHGTLDEGRTDDSSVFALS